MIRQSDWRWLVIYQPAKTEPDRALKATEAAAPQKQRLFDSLQLCFHSEPRPHEKNSHNSKTLAVREEAGVILLIQMRIV